MSTSNKNIEIYYVKRKQEKILENKCKEEKIPHRYNLFFFKFWGKKAIANYSMNF